jgi:malate dehydrogenase (oxaloacetate-decarboxylating)(NADP+)
LSEQVTENEMKEGRIYPNLNRIKNVSFKIAVDIVKHAESTHICHLHPKPESIEKHIQKYIYDPSY